MKSSCLVLFNAIIVTDVAVALINSRYGKINPSKSYSKVESPRDISRLKTKRLLANEMQRDDSNNDIEDFRLRLERDYIKYDPLEERLGYFDDDYTPSRLKYTADSIANVYGEAVVDNLRCDDECDQCEIPDKFKILGSQSRLDVMAFLGIKRAQPLRVERKQDRNWD